MDKWKLIIPNQELLMNAIFEPSPCILVSFVLNLNFLDFSLLVEKKENLLGRYSLCHSLSSSFAQHKIKHWGTKWLVCIKWGPSLQWCRPSKQFCSTVALQKHHFKYMDGENFWRNTAQGPGLTTLSTWLPNLLGEGADYGWGCKRGVDRPYTITYLHNRCIRQPLIPFKSDNLHM